MSFNTVKKNIQNYFINPYFIITFFNYSFNMNVVIITLTIYFITIKFRIYIIIILNIYI